MRPDMGKVITERPRRKGLGKLTRKGYTKRLLRDGLDHVKGESITKLRNHDKDFTDLLGPIVGFLTKSCGRPWSKVHSEISQALPATGGVSYSHARDHLFQMVEEHTQVIDGQVYDSKGFKLSESRRWKQFYVDQHDILRQTKQTWKHYRSPQPKVFPKSESGEWLIEDEKGIWWACEMAPYESSGVETLTYKAFGNVVVSKSVPIFPQVFDAFLRVTSSNPKSFSRFYQGKYHHWQDATVYCIRKRQLGKREIKKYGLRKKHK
jgi:hypothetical protein